MFVVQVKDREKAEVKFELYLWGDIEKAKDNFAFNFNKAYKSFCTNPIYKNYFDVQKESFLKEYARLLQIYCEMPDIPKEFHTRALIFTTGMYKWDNESKKKVFESL